MTLALTGAVALVTGGGLHHLRSWTSTAAYWMD